jgi:hypothetical protein
LEKALTNDNCNLYLNKSAFDKLITICLESLHSTGRSGFVTKARSFPVKKMVYFEKVDDRDTPKALRLPPVVNMVT